jgi:hypothetical protein
MPPIFGDTAAIGKLQVVNTILTGTVSSTLPNSLTSLVLDGSGYFGGTPGGQSVKIESVRDATNSFTLLGAAKSGRPVLQAAGRDTNVGMSLATQGTGAPIVLLDGANGRILSASNASGGAVANSLEVTSVGTGRAPTIAATGTDANIGINLETKGSGAVQINGVATRPALAASTGRIGGSPLLAGGCIAANVAVHDATAAMAVAIAPTTYPGDGFFWQGFVPAPGTVTVKVCAIVAGTPKTSAYNVRVIQ